jgi:SAM-dependent methyltransferase
MVHALTPVLEAGIKDFNSMEKNCKNTEGRVQREKEWHNRLAQGEFNGVYSKKFRNNSVFYKCHDKLEKYITRELDSTKTVLDYCCGGENYLIRNASSMKEGAGIDISDILIARQNELKGQMHIENLRFEVMDAMNTSFSDNTFDVIRGQAVLHHLDIEKSIREIKRILKDGGKAFFEEPLNTNPVMALYRKKTPQYRTEDESAFTRKDIKLIRRYFPKMEIEYYFCFTLLAVPFRNAKRFKKIVDILFAIDKIFLHRRSPFKWLAWCCIITVQK